MAVRILSFYSLVTFRHAVSAGQIEYVQQLKDAFRRLGIVVPTMHNDAGMFRNLVNIPDIYGFDQYPLSEL